MKEKAILVVSFGTSYADTCDKTIGKIENEIRDAYPEYEVVRAWTSGIIRRKIEKRDGIHTYSVSEAMEQMCKKGVREVIVQPTHILNGIENEIMEKVVMAFQVFYDKITISKPLLTSHEDSKEIIDFLQNEWKINDDEMLILMGHGTEHHSNFVYAALNYQLQLNGCENMIMGTVEGYPTIDEVLRAVKKQQPRKIILTPFMLVAGDHANNDLAGEDDDSWKSMFEKEGYHVECVLKGLGEYPEIRQIFRIHLEEAIEK